jgi:flavin-dependent dehydrogenase
MLAMQLAAAGREVTLLEKEPCAHHKVCGEFLSSEAVRYLRRAGVEPLELGAATIRFLRLAAKRTLMETALPFTALSLSRYVLDEALLARAGEMGCSVRRGAHVESLTRDNGTWLAQIRTGESWTTPTVFLASGKHDLRGLLRPQSQQGDLIGFKLHWRLAPTQTEALRDHMDLFLFTGGYGGLSLVEQDVANLCLVVRRAALRRIGGWEELLAAICNENRHVFDRLQGATALWNKPLAISPIPYGHLGGRPGSLWCVGDQEAVIPSFTGDGMSIAFHSAGLAAQLYLDGQSAAQYHAKLESHLKSSMRLATWLSRAMVTAPGRALAPFGLSLYPGAMRWVAQMTRIPEHALAAPSGP